MRKIYKLLPLVAALIGGLVSCQSQDPHFTATEDDYPIILNSTFDKTGQPNSFPSIYRNENFTFELVYTPAEHSTVNWFIDGEMVFEGKEIDMPVMAGLHNVKVVVTTSKGLQTYRTASLKVLALEGDPTLNDDEKSRWLQLGTKKSINGSNLGGIVKALLKVVNLEDGSRRDLELANFDNAGSKLSFDIPAELAEGNYHLILENAEGEQFGAGEFQVHSSEYEEPVVTENIIWTGEAVINWGDTNVTLSSELASVPVGSTIVLHYEFPNAEYYALRITNQDWSKDIVKQIDGFKDKYPDGFEFEYTADVKAIVDESCMLITGFGYKLTKVGVK